MTDKEKLDKELCSVLEIDLSTLQKSPSVIKALREISDTIPAMDSYEKRMIFLTLRIMEQKIRKDQMTIDHEKSLDIMYKVHNDAK